ncbi:MAG TPA: hypothetical protein VF656_19360 [Pyrinomonadaceae bacterium]|jgi:hypothetical protein
MFLLLDLAPTPPGKAESFVLVLAALLFTLTACACLATLIIFFVRRRRKAARATNDAHAPAQTEIA